ncbi:MAG: PIG-L family deacetylase [Bryobacterales bacterium]|nr:PIG-L family deacetylase [Bryobacterales bacterium]
MISSIMQMRWRFLPLSILLLLPQPPARAQRNLAGAVRTRLALERLNVLGSVMTIAAHPDDENAALLAYVARGRKARAAFLALTRGDGGQNLIGAEQGELLGLIRTQELLAARAIDGAEQFFTRAIDFGFSKTAEETFQKWGHDAILADVVWTVRRFRPDVIVVGFNIGHGHHQAAGILAREAFTAAADKARFPEQLRWVEPWQARRLLAGGFGPMRAPGGAAQPGIPINTGEFDPLLGFSYSEIAGMSRSMHRSQGMGSPERRGSAVSSPTVEAGEPATSDIFEGIDITWNRLPGGAAVASILKQAAATFAPAQPEKTIPLLLKARPLAAAIRDPWAALKLAELDEAIALCSGLWLDASADRHTAVPAGELQVNFEAINRSRFPLVLKGVKLEGMAGTPAEEFAPLTLAYNQPERRTLKMTIPPGQPYSQPYWLRKPNNGFVFAIDDRQMIGLAEAPAVLRARIRIQAGPEEIEFIRPVMRRFVDRVEGETTRPLVVAPPVAVSFSEPVLMFPEAKARTVEVLLRGNVSGASGELRLDAPPGWRVQPGAAVFRIAALDDETALSFTVVPPAGAGSGELRAVARLNGREISNGMRVIAHEGIPPQTIFPEATAKLVRADARTLARKVGYVMGAGDEVPRALRQMGCEVTLLAAEDLARGDLSRFDAIVTGVRAYNVRPDLVANQQRMLDYVEQGGTLVVQYVTADRFSSSLKGFGPYPMQLGGSRVTVEEAPVKFLNPGHPLLNAPNKIGEADFQGWIQERGLYFASQWDPRYEPLFELNDPNEPPQRGATLYARYGKGAYIFTSLSWFRQLPADVPGAFRIFANFLSAGRSPR